MSQLHRTLLFVLALTTSNSQWPANLMAVPQAGHDRYYALSERFLSTPGVFEMVYPDSTARDSAPFDHDTAIVDASHSVVIFGGIGTVEGARYGLDIRVAPHHFVHASSGIEAANLGGAGDTEYRLALGYSKSIGFKDHLRASLSVAHSWGPYGATNLALSPTIGYWGYGRSIISFSVQVGPYVSATYGSHATNLEPIGINIDVCLGFGFLR